ncbi:hypothetical protein BDB01DRAFT_722323 [Pilobolus umbonatus]|nr:hypothetical protein BDB01DRAFT_722323 [Pilobolus umbonatus]
MMFSTVRQSITRGSRFSHTLASARSVPPTRGSIQDVESFLKSIGRDCESYSSKFEVNII